MIISGRKDEKAQRNGHDKAETSHKVRNVTKIIVFTGRSQRIDYTHFEEQLLVCPGTLHISYQMIMRLELSIMIYFLLDPTSHKVGWVRPEVIHCKMERVHLGLNMSRARYTA